MKIRQSVVLAFALSGVVAWTAEAQISTGAYGTNSAAVSSSATQQPKGYTSYDNPYATGGAYDPYRNGPATGTGIAKGGLQAKSPGAGQYSATRMGTVGSSLSGALGGAGQCGGHRSGSGGMAGLNMNRPASTSGGHSSLSSCGGNHSGGAAGRIGKNSRLGMSGQAYGMQHQSQSR